VIAEVLFLLLAAIISARSPIGQPPAADAVVLFDGKSFQGWEGNLKIFRIEDGAIVGGSLTEKIVRNEFLCTTTSYGDFELRLKVKLVGGDAANAGIQFRTSRIPDNHEVAGYQADMGTGWWGALYDESRRKKVLVQAPPNTPIRHSDWNDYVITAQGPKITLELNGVKTVEYTEQEAGIAQDGFIALQVHSGPAIQVEFRNLKIRELR